MTTLNSFLLQLLVILGAQSDDNVTTVPVFSPYYSGFSPRRAFPEIFITSSACPNEVSPASVQRPTVAENLTGGAEVSPENASTGNCTNNLTDPTAITKQVSSTETAPPVTDEPSKQPIVTFDEWTKEKLRQEQRKAVPPVAAPTPVVSSTAPSRNYASRECGAKILVSNPEAENSKAILNDKEKDEYMRNPCVKAGEKFIVLELCETIQPQQIVFGNFELFSSGPKDFRVFVAERPGSDWQSLGNFTAADTRQLQTFNVESRLYAKLLKIELVSHHGNEHYCTVSVLKVMGSSMVDEYEYEAHLASQAEVRMPAVVVDEIPPASPVHIKVPAVGATTDAPPPATASESSPIAEPVPKNEQKPIVQEIVDQGGKLFNNIVKVVKSKLTGRTEMARKYKQFDMSLCKVCPLDDSCIVPTHLCWVFVWRPTPRNSTIPIDPLDLPSRRMFSEKQRRRRFAFYQRQMYEKQDAVVTSDGPEVEPLPVAETLPVVEIRIEEPSVVTTPPLQPTLSEALPAASVSHKESVFMKLNKRIAALELNMSLSSEYLSELSRQYVAQTDEHKRHMEQARKTAQEVAEGVETRLNRTIADRLTLMRKEMDALSQWLHSMRITASEIAYSWQIPEKDKCRMEDSTAVRHYVAKREGWRNSLWTMDEVLLYVIVCQGISILVFTAITIYICRRRRPDPNTTELERLINLQIEQALEARAPTAAPAALSQNQKKKRRKRNRPPGPHGYPSSDSAVSRTTTCPTETSSEAESARLLAQQLLDATIRPPTPSEKSEEEDQRAWIPVRRKNST